MLLIVWYVLYLLHAPAADGAAMGSAGKSSLCMLNPCGSPRYACRDRAPAGGGRKGFHAGVGVRACTEGTQGGDEAGEFNSE